MDRPSAAVAGAPPLSQICVRRAARGLSLAGYVRCAHPQAVPGTPVYVRAWEPHARAQATVFRLFVQVAGVETCYPGWLVDLPEEWEEELQVFFGSFRRGQEPGCGKKGLAFRPLRCGCQGVGE